MELLETNLENNLTVKYSSDQKIMKTITDVQYGLITHSLYTIEWYILSFTVCLFVLML